MFDIIKKPAQCKVDKLDDLCADYQHYLQKRAQAKGSRGFKRSTVKAREKLNFINVLRAVLHKEAKPEQKLNHFKERFSHETEKLKAHRNSFAQRFTLAVFTLLSGGLAKLIATAFNKKPASSNAFTFWRSHGENVVKKVQRLTR